MCKQLVILVVDDSASVGEGLARILELTRHTVLVAESGQQGLEMLETRGRQEGECVEVVFSDMDMPGMNGVRFLRQVREQYPLTARILMSGDLGRVVIQDALRDGVCHALMAKPCDPDFLLVVIEQAQKVRANVFAPPRSE